MSQTSLTRRAALMASAGLAAATTTTPVAAQAARKTFVLVHGAYHGGWCWKFVAEALEAKGHKVYAPSLTGNGDRTHMLSNTLTLDMQAADISNLIKFEDLKNVCLVAHSFGGWPVSVALEAIADRVSSLVMVDAFMPNNGEKSADYISEFSRKAMEEAIAKGEAGRMPPPAKTYSITEKHYAWIDSKLTPQPNSIAFNTVTLTGKRETIAKKTYIRAPKYPQASFDKAYEACKANASWQTFVVEDSGHDVMVDKPEWLTDLLLKVS